MIGSQLEKVFYHYIFKNREYVDAVNERFFEINVLKELFLISKEFFEKYKKAPTKVQIEELVGLKGVEEKITKEKIDLIYKEDLSNYDEAWLKENIEAWIEWKAFDVSVMDLINFLQVSKPDVSNVKDIITQGKNIISERNRVDLNFDSGLDFFNPESHIQPTYDTFSTGYNHLDIVTGGGYSAKTLWCLIGRAKIGKSIWLSNLAAKAVRAGNNVAFLSMEMADRKVVKRLGANLLAIKMQEYNKFADDQITLKKKLANIGISDLKTPGQFFIKEFPTSSASVNDIENYLIKMEEIRDMKFKIVFVDYINIMKNWRNPNTENLYMKIKQIAEDLRAMAVRNKWSVVTATQINRCLDVNSIVETPKGKKKIGDIKEGEFVLTPTGFSEVGKVWPKTKQKTYKIKTKSGKEIICSGVHQHPIINKNGEEELIQTSSLKIGDKFLTKK